MFYNWKYCSFYPKNFGASALNKKMKSSPSSSFSIFAEASLSHSQ